MNLVENLSCIADYSGIYTLADLLQEIGVKFDQLPQSDFVETSIILILHSHHENKDDFLRKLKNGLRAGENQQSLNDFIDSVESRLPTDHVQHKESKEMYSRNFRMCERYLRNSEMHWLYTLIGAASLELLLQYTVNIRRFGQHYWQIWGRRMDGFFDDLKKNKKKEPNFVVKARTNTHTKGYMRNIRQYFKQYINKNHMLYCLHSNGKYDFFRKSKIARMATSIKELISKGATEEEQKNCLLSVGKGIKKEIFADYMIQHKESSAEFDLLAGQFIHRFSKVDVHSIGRRCCSLDPQYFEVKKEYEAFMKEKHNEAKRDQIPPLLSKLVKLDTSAKKVKKFVEEFVRLSTPVEFIGPSNRMTLIKESGRITVMKKYEMISFDEIIGKLKFKEIKWLKRKITTKNKGTIFSENKEYLRQFLYYFMNHYVIQLIRANFYVTEKHHEHNKLFFYSKPVWYMITNLSMLNIATLNLAPLNLFEGHESTLEAAKGDKKLLKKEIFERKNDLLISRPCAKLRLVPKSDSVRPIMTFYKRFKDPSGYQNKHVKVGHYLKNAKIVLRTLKRTMEDRQGFAVFDNYQIFDRYSKFKKTWREDGSPPLFYGTMDIQKCYDSVELDRLYELLKLEDVFQDFYLITNFMKVLRNRRFAFRKKNKNNDKFKMSNLFLLKERDSAVPLEHVADITKYTLDEVTKQGKTIFIDRERKTVVSKTELMENITFVCKGVVIRFGNLLYRLKRGLPQGLSISSVLSSFYYSCLERNALNGIYDVTRFNNSKELVMRLTDDYLIISENKEMVKQLVERLHIQAEKSNFSFNESKKSFNFELGDFKPSAPTEEIQNFKWIGKEIDIKNLEIEHTQILDEKAAFFTVSTNISYLEKFPAQVIKAKLKSFILNHNLFYLDPSVNSKEKILEILKKVTQSAYLKIKTYFNRILGEDSLKLKRDPSKKEELYIGKKVYEALIDSAISVYGIFEEKGHPEATKKDILMKEIFDVIREEFLGMLKKDLDLPAKRKLFNLMKNKIDERDFSFWSNSNAEIKIID